ncbi:RNA polymerase III RPC4-domain-containing protein [Tricladium varicosporioides]|nr:RNA polymerase III RPC4-domain-containing protein [Hymenoscyphus varicosporioides]
MTGRGATRGRGRAGRRPGRGRGKAAAEPSAESPTASELTLQEQASQSTITLSPTKEDPPQITTPQNNTSDNSNAPSPNSSPVTVPTETPAPTPSRPSALRTDSNNESAMPSAVSRDGAMGEASRGRGAAAKLKFKPQIRRRDRSERDLLAEQEQKRIAELQKKEDLEREKRERAASRGRGFRGGRGRGDVMGRGSGRGTTGSGLFGVAPEAMARRRENEMISGPSAGPSAGSSGGGGPSGSRVKTEGGPFSRGGGSGSGGYTLGGKLKGEFYEPDYPGFEDDDTPRVDIEQINLISDDEEQPALKLNSKGKSREVIHGLRPIRLAREEHKERVTIVNTVVEKTEPDEVEIKKDIDEVQKYNDEMEIDEDRSTHILPIGDGVRVKTEPGMEVEYRPPPHNPAAPPSPELHNRPEKVASSLNSSPKKEKMRRPSKRKDIKPVFVTEEDKAEYERHLEDIRVLAEELGSMKTAVEPLAINDADGDVAMGDAEEAAKEDKLGRLYLFQFPPVLPKLYNPITKQKPQTKKVTEPRRDVDGDVEITGSTTKPSQLGGKEVKIKTEEAVIVKLEEEAEKESDDIVDEEGWVGKLLVRKSGRIELSWGGTSMVVARGVNAGFLSTGVVVDSLEKGVNYPNGEKPEGKALGMGNIMGRMVVIPDWEKME